MRSISRPCGSPFRLRLVAEPQQVTRMQNDIADKLAAIPGVTSVGFASAMPMEGIEPDWDAIYVEGKTYPAR